MTGALALVAALTISSQLQTHPTGLPSIGPSRARSLRTAPIMDKLYEQAGKPGLDLDFARYKDLHDNASGKTSIVSFSRNAAQSPGTYVGSDGLIKTAAVNLALYSEQFDQWTQSGGATVSANQAIAPDGKQTADRIDFTASTLARVERAVVYPSGNTLTFSVWMRTESGTKNVGIRAHNSTTTTVTVTAEWQRFTVTNTTIASTQYPLIINVDGDTTHIYIWGAQLEEGTATPYIRTESLQVAAPRFDHDPVTG